MFWCVPSPIKPFAMVTYTFTNAFLVIATNIEPRMELLSITVYD